MKKLIGIAAFVTIGLFGFTHEAPPVQAANGPLSSPMVDSEFAAQAPKDLGCPWWAPVCCDPDENGGCFVCITRNQACP